MTIGQSAGKGFAYIVGVYLGDGCVTRQNSRGEFCCTVFRLNTIDADFALTVKRTLEDLGSRWCSINTHPVSKSSKPNHSLTARHDELCAYLVEITDGKRKLPSDIFDWPRENRLAFIAGLMDSEGYVGKHSPRKKPEEAHWRLTNRSYYMGFKSCDEWVAEFARVLESVGIRIGKLGIERPLKPGYKTPRRFTIKMQSWIDAGATFNIERKNARVREWASAAAYAQRSVYPRRPTSETIRGTPAVSG